MKPGRLVLLLSLLALAGGCATNVAVLYDFDGDGSLDADDCGPSEETIHPGAQDCVGDGIDQDCDGVDGTDSDGDGSARTSEDPNCAGGDDCNDGDASVHPGATEIPGNDNDENCDGVDDFDTDGDGSPDSVDCSPEDPSISPLAPELCADGLDNDCDGQVDEADAIDATEWFADLDGDGVGGNLLNQQSCSQPDGYAVDSSDCDDTDANNYPGNTELCDSQDNNCDSAVDEGFDLDGDGAFDGTDTSCAATYGLLADCDDGDSGIHPGANDSVGDDDSAGDDDTAGDDDDSAGDLSLRLRCASAAFTETGSPYLSYRLEVSDGGPPWELALVLDESHPGDQLSGSFSPVELDLQGAGTVDDEAVTLTFTGGSLSVTRPPGGAPGLWRGSMDYDVHSGLSVSCWEPDYAAGYSYDGVTGQCVDGNGQVGLNPGAVPYIRETQQGLGAYLSGADLNEGNLAYPELTSWDLRGADLAGAELFFADLVGAQLQGTLMAGIGWGYAHITGTVDAFTTLPMGCTPDAQDQVTCSQ